MMSLGEKCMKYTGFDSHVDENGVLKNYFGIKDQDKLEQVERDIVSYKESILKDNQIRGKFDLKHLQNIHKYLFGDIYPFAGKIRDGYLQKGEQDFTMGYRIIPQSEKLFAQLKKEHYLRNTEPEKLPVVWLIT